MVEICEVNAAEVNNLAERKVQAPTHRASGASVVVNSAKFTSFVGIFIGRVLGE